MANFTLTLGTLDLSPYLVVVEGDGLNPAPDYLNPAFLDSPFADGQPLTSVTSANREQVYPLALKAASKDALHALVASIRLTLDNSPKPLRLTWQDQGASLPSYFDVEFGRLEVDFRYWRQTHNYLSAKLHVWVRPYAHTATERIIGTMAATQGFGALLAVPSLAGDIGGLLDVTIGLTAGSYALPAKGASPVGASPANLAGIALLPFGYVPEFPAASIGSQVNFPLVADAFAPASQAVHATSVNDGTKGAAVLFPAAVIASPGLYAGRNRVLGIVKTSSPTPLYVNAVDHNGSSIGPTQVYAPPASGHPGYAVLDLGILNVDSYYAPTAALRVNAGLATVFTACQIYSFDLAGLVMVPEASTAFIVDNFAQTTNGNAQTATYQLVSTQNRATRDVTPRNGSSIRRGTIDDGRRGSFPRAQPGASQQIYAFAAQQPGSFGGQTMAATVKCRERFSYSRG